MGDSGRVNSGGSRAENGNAAIFCVGYRGRKMNGFVVVDYDIVILILILIPLRHISPLRLYII